ncbi:Mediator of RNA polymerase II transcription subunit 9 [Linum grandiflorum]
MDNQFGGAAGGGGGGWTMIPNLPAHANSPSHSNQDQYFLHQQQQQQQQPPLQQFNQFQQQQLVAQQQFNQQQFQQQTQQQQQLQQQRMLQQQQQQQQQPQPQQTQHHQSLASHFHLFPWVDKLADAIENGTRDQHSDVLVNELNNQFDKCQQLLNSISSSITSKSMTVEGQKKKLEETEQLLNQRRDLIGEYKTSVEDIVKSEP